MRIPWTPALQGGHELPRVRGQCLDAHRLQIQPGPFLSSLGCSKALSGTAGISLPLVAPSSPCPLPPSTLTVASAALLHHTNHFFSMKDLQVFQSSNPVSSGWALGQAKHSRSRERVLLGHWRRPPFPWRVHSAMPVLDMESGHWHPGRGPPGAGFLSVTSGVVWGGRQSAGARI